MSRRQAEVPSALPDNESLQRRRVPASAKSEQRVRDILRVSREVFSELGYEHATTMEVAQRLGVSEATVFTYFHGKRELCVQVIVDWYDEIIEAMERGLPRERPIKEQFEFIVRTHLRLFLTSGTGMCALVLSEGRVKGQNLGETVQPLQRRYIAPLTELLARGQASGEIRRDVPLRLLRTMVFGPIEHVLWDVVAAEKSMDLDAVTNALVHALWTSVQAPDAELAALRRLRQDVELALQRTDPA